MNILGISAFYHDSAACLVQDGKIVSAAQEERFSRKKHDHSFPENSINYCLENSNLKAEDLDYIVFYDKPLLKFERILETYLAYAPCGIVSFMKALPLWIKDKLWIKDLIYQKCNFSKEVLFIKHHLSHAASAFFPSPYQKAAFLTLDGVGEWATASFGVGDGNNIKILEELNFPHSLGLLYSAFTYYLGFKVNSGEYKIMGLAPYGEPKYYELILDKLMDLKQDGSFKLNMKYFNYCTGLTMINRKFEKLFGQKVRKPNSAITPEHINLASSLQKVTEEVILRMVRYVYEKTKCSNLCLAGGVALNCVANGKVLKQGPFKNLWIQPASGDAGGALGAALFIWYQYLANKRLADGVKDFQQGSLLGPKYGNDYISSYLEQKGIHYVFVNDDEMLSKVADLIVKGEVVGWFQGRMEFGPRALGSRSIIADARIAKMQSIINRKVKFRESFRPFAPAVLEEKVSELFDIEQKSPYMLLVAKINESISRRCSEEEKNFSGFQKLKVARSKIPSVTHVDYSSRIQSVSEESNPLFYELIKIFYDKTGCPAIINTSFNVKDEPIVCTPEEAYNCFEKTGLDSLVMGNFLIEKNRIKG